MGDVVVKPVMSLAEQAHCREQTVREREVRELRAEVERLRYQDAWSVQCINELREEVERLRGVAR